MNIAIRTDLHSMSEWQWWKIIHSKSLICKISPRKIACGQNQDHERILTVTGNIKIKQKINLYSYMKVYFDYT
jgi:hypothetical protein